MAHFLGCAFRKIDNLSRLIHSVTLFPVPSTNFRAWTVCSPLALEPVNGQARRHLKGSFGGPAHRGLCAIGRYKQNVFSL